MEAPEAKKKLPRGRAWQFLTKEKKREALRELLEPVVSCSEAMSKRELLLMLVDVVAKAI